MTATVEAALAFLESQLGVAEYPAGSNANWLTDWYGMGHVAWCAITVSRALIEAGFGTADRIDVPGVEATSAKGWAYCPYLEADFRAAGRWHDGDPEPGDLVLYDWDGDEWADHVGMLQRVDPDGTPWVYEGNTDEGVLRLKHRSMTYVRGFARPPYTVAPAPEPEPAPPVQEDDMATAGCLYTLYNWGSGVFLVGPWGGPPVLLGTDENVRAYLAIGATVIGTVNDATHRDFGGRTSGPVALSSAEAVALVAGSAPPG